MHIDNSSGGTLYIVDISQIVLHAYKSIYFCKFLHIYIDVCNNDLSP